ncbi:MAG: ABC transporter ATP-binding protein/permease [Marinisporobacter sp.]|jgi:ATP-binding cassette subfamily B protein|nr:ABC transporter ATP-binding protein/permease [Marinisporobacter sp.]
MLCSVRRILKLSGSFQSKVKRGILFGIMESMFSCAPLLFMYLFIQDMIKENLSYGSIFKYTIGLAICLLVQYIFHLKEMETISSVGYEVIADKRKEVARFLKKMPMGDFLGKTLGEINAIVTNELTQIELYAMQLVSKVVSSISSLVLTILFLLSLDVSMTIAFFSGFPISYLLNRIIRKMYVRSAKAKLEGETKLIENTVEYTQGITTVKAYNNGENHSKRMKHIFKEFVDQTIKADAKMIPLLQSYSMFMYLGFGVALSLGSYLLMHGKIDYSVFLMFSVMGIQIYQPFEILSAYGGTLKAMEGSLDQVEHLMRFTPMEEPEEDFDCKNFSVEFSNVTFGYNEKKVLKNISFVAKENTLTAITGPSGSGKTTLIQLIMRFWDIESGEIKIGGKDIREYKIETLMKYISVVFQDNYLFNDTIYNNIKYGNEKATKEEIEKAARLACCHEFIEKLPKAYETIVGEGGSTLSGGERQRIAIARAIVKDSPIIILDEATSGVDPINEIEIQRGIANLVKGKTVFMIAHKFAAITEADKILVLDGGELKEEGTHDELIEKDGIYKNLWKGQIGVDEWKIRKD